MSIEDPQYSFLPFIKLLSTTAQQPLLSSILNKYKISKNILDGKQKISQSLLSEIFLFCESNNQIGIAFSYGLNSETGSLGLLDYYLASCENLITAAEQFVYFFPLITRLKSQPRLNINSQQQLEFFISKEETEIASVRIIKEFIFASAIALFSRLNNHQWPLKIDMPQQSFSKIIYEKLSSLEIEISFSSNQYRLTLPTLQHQAALPFSNETTRVLLKPELERLLADSKQSESIIVDILKLFDAEKQIAYISQNSISESLSISESGLKRRLAEAGSNFSNVLSRYKREKALDFLNKQTLSIDEVSDKLGYSDRSSFNRAFKQWTNITPSQYLQQISLAELRLETIKATDIDSLPTSPKICQQVFELTQSDNFDIPQLTRLVQTDPILTGKLISIANSAYYGGNNIADINQAIIQVLGVDVVQNMVFSLMCCTQMKIDNCPEFSLQAFWFQSIFTAEAIKLLSHHEVIKSNISSSEIYLAALLHKIGDYVLVYLKPKIMSRYLKDDMKSSDFHRSQKDYVDSQLLQHKIFGLSSEVTGALVLTQWGLPNSVCDLVRALDSNYSNQTSISKILVLLSLFSQHQLHNIEDAGIPQEFLQELSEVMDVDSSELNKSLIKIVNKIESIDLISREISRT